MSSFGNFLSCKDIPTPYVKHIDLDDKIPDVKNLTLKKIENKKYN